MEISDFFKVTLSTNKKKTKKLSEKEHNSQDIVSI